MEPQQLLKRVDSFTVEYQEFILSDFTEEACRSVQSAGYSGFNTTVLENGVFLYLTLFLHKFSLTEFIITECNQSISDARAMTNIIIDMMPVEMTGLQAEATLALDLSDDLIKEKDRFMIISSHENLQNRYLYLKTSDFTHRLAQKYLGTNEEAFDQFKVIISDIALGFYKKEDTVPLLQQELGLDSTNAGLLGTEVLTLLENISTDSWTPTATTNHLHPVTPVTEDVILPELRTMAADMMEGRSPVRSTFNATTTIDEPVYVSIQPTIEKQILEAPSYTAPLYQPPKPNVDTPLEKPRWG